MKKCLTIFVHLSVIGFCFFSSTAICSENPPLRIRQLEREINREERALRALKKRYENVLKKKQITNRFLEARKRREEQSKDIKEGACCRRLKRLEEAQRRRAFQEELTKLKRKEIRKNVMESALLRMQR